MGKEVSKMVTTQVLRALLAAEGYVSGHALAQALGVSRNAVWKAVTALREEGCDIEAGTNRGYRLLALPQTLHAKTVQALCCAAQLGQVITVLPTATSTNALLREWAATGSVGGTVVATGHQTAGRGRRGRSFDSAVGGLYVSVLLRPQNWKGDASLITSCAAVAVARAIERVCAVEVQIKWVNDLFVSGKKVCGILTEAGLDMETGELTYAVLGVGLNTAKREFPAELQEIATSLGNLTGADCDRNRLLAAILEELEPALLQLEDGTFLEESRRRSCVLGHTVMVHAAEGAYEAQAVDITKNGHLLVKRADGTLTALHSGEVSVRL